MIGHIHVHISVCIAVNKHDCCCKSPIGLFVKMKSEESKVSCAGLWLHRSYLGFKWLFSNGFCVNPIGATHSPRQTLCSHPLNSSVVACEGGAPSG